MARFWCSSLLNASWNDKLLFYLFVHNTTLSSLNDCSRLVCFYFGFTSIHSSGCHKKNLSETYYPVENVSVKFSCPPNPKRLSMLYETLSDLTQIYLSPISPPPLTPQSSQAVLNKLPLIDMTWCDTHQLSCWKVPPCTFISAASILSLSTTCSLFWPPSSLAH